MGDDGEMRCSWRQGRRRVGFGFEPQPLIWRFLALLALVSMVLKFVLWTLLVSGAAAPAPEPDWQPLPALPAAGR